MFGYSFNIISLGLGARYFTWSEKLKFKDYDYEGESTIAIYGPMGYLGASDMFGDLPLGWYVGASYMFYDLGNFEDMDMEHYNVEGGLFLAVKKWVGTLGYRYKDYYDPGLTFKGAVVSLSYRFEL